MQKRTSFFILLFLSSLILLSFFSGCLPVTPVTVTGTVSGYVALPDNTSKDLTGYSPIPGATVTVIDADGISHTVLTDENGYYYFNNISIKANTIINITKDTEGGGKLIFKDIVPLAVSQEEDYDAGIADAESTATALVVEGLVNLDQPQEEIDLDEITSSDGFDGLKEDIQQAQEDNQDFITDNPVNTQAEEIADNIVNPQEPTPTPTLSSAKEITSYKFEAAKNVALSSDVIGIVNSGDHTIALTVSYGTDLKALVATFELSTSASAKVGSTVQASGTTANDFTNTVTYTVTAEDNSTQDWVVTVTVAIGPLDHFTITGYPVSTTAGENFASNNIIVTAYDGNNKIKTDYTGQVYFTSTDASAIVPYTSGSNYIFIVGDNGTHTFPGTGFTLKTAGSKTITLTDRTVSVTSNDITVNPASLDHIVILPNTASITAGTTQVYTAKAFDAANNSLGDVSTSTTFTIDAGAGGSWSTFTYTSATSGIWTVTGTYSGKTDTASLTVNPGAATKLSFTVQPSNTNSETAITPDLEVTVQDTYGNTITSDNTTSVTVAIGTNPDSGTLSGTATQTVSGGVATFDDLSIDKAGTGYTLTASADHSYTETTSESFNITAGSITKIVFTTSSQTLNAGSVSSIMIIQTQDASGNPGNVLEDRTIDLTSTSANGKFYSDAGGTTVITSVTISSGTNSANFYYQDTTAGTPAITSAEDPSQGWTDATQGETINPGSLDHFTFDTISNQTAGIAFNITITAKDSSENTVTSFTSTAALTVNQGTISPTTTGSFDNGLLSGFSVTIPEANTGVTITATASEKTGTSNSFNVTAGAATQVWVETAADGSGGVVPAQSLAQGSSITVYAISRDASDNFVANIAADESGWSLTKTGDVVDNDLVPAGDSKSAVFTANVAGTAVIKVVKTDLIPTNSGTITVWNLTVTYNGNDSTCGEVPTDSKIYKKDDTVTVLGNSGNLVRTGFAFTGWNIQADGLGTDQTEGSTFVMGTENVMLYAKWTALYALRNTGPAGGLIFYVKEGSYSDGWMYLEAAPSDQSTGAEWGCWGVTIDGADGTAVGTGEQNTADIEAGCTTADNSR